MKDEVIAMVEGGLTIYGTSWCSDCKRSKRFLGEQRIGYNWVDVEDSPEGLAFIEKAQHGNRSVPTIVFPDGEVLVEPSNSDLARKLNISTRAKNQFYEVIVVGGGPAGLTAALYTAREGLSTLVIDRSGLGGQVATTEQLDNFPGFPDGISGAEFSRRLVAQAHRFEVETIAAQTVTYIAKDGDYCLVRTEDGEEYRSKALLIATGATYQRLGVKGEEALIGSSVHYCATCDGPFYRGKEVAVIGSGNGAAEEGIFLTNFASHVTLLVRGDKLKASKVAVDKVNESTHVNALYNTEVVELRGSPRLKEVLIRDRASGKISTLDPAPEGVFVFIGQTPNTEGLPPEIEKDARGFVITSPTLETSVPGIFAAGDVRAGSTSQAASAAGEGSAVAIMIRDYIRRNG